MRTLMRYAVDVKSTYTYFSYCCALQLRLISPMCMQEMVPAKVAPVKNGKAAAEESSEEEDSDDEEEVKVRVTYLR